MSLSLQGRVDARNSHAKKVVQTWEAPESGTEKVTKAKEPERRASLRQIPFLGPSSHLLSSLLSHQPVPTPSG